MCGLECTCARQRGACGIMWCPCAKVSGLSGIARDLKETCGGLNVPCVRCLRRNLPLSRCPCNTVGRPALLHHPAAYLRPTAITSHRICRNTHVLLSMQQPRTPTHACSCKRRKSRPRSHVTVISTWHRDGVWAAEGSSVHGIATQFHHVLHGTNRE